MPDDERGPAGSQQEEEDRNAGKDVGHFPMRACISRHNGTHILSQGT